MTTELDELDRRLLHRLAEELPLDLTAVAREIGTTADDAAQRFLRLRGAGVVSECVARIDPAAVGIGCTAFLLVRVAQNADDLAAIRQLFGDLEAVEEAHAVPATSTGCSRSAPPRSVNCRTSSPASCPWFRASSGRRPASCSTRPAISSTPTACGWPGIDRGGWTGVEEAQARENHGAAQRRLAQRSVALIGFMGVGKTVRRARAGPAARPAVRRHGRDGAAALRRAIPELFARGEATFRALERAAMLEALNPPGRVLALGGGAFIQPGCPELLLPRALVVHLYTPWRVMRELLPELAADRPLIRDRPTYEIQQLFLSRPRHTGGHTCGSACPGVAHSWPPWRSSRCCGITPGRSESRL